MRAAGEAAYQVNLVYVGVRDVRHSIGRVRERVSRGGHDVPIADLWRRFDRSLANLAVRSEEHTSELQSLMRSSYAVFCLKKKRTRVQKENTHINTTHTRSTRSYNTFKTIQHNTHKSN